MKVVCIDNKGWEKWITIGKIYDTIGVDNSVYYIINDENARSWYLKERFKPLSEYRIEKIDKLLRE